jgi:hypothetical protein
MFSSTEMADITTFGAALNEYLATFLKSNKPQRSQTGLLSGIKQFSWGKSDPAGRGDVIPVGL